MMRCNSFFFKTQMKYLKSKIWILIRIVTILTDAVNSVYSSNNYKLNK